MTIDRRPLYLRPEWFRPRLQALRGPRRERDKALSDLVSQRGLCEVLLLGTIMPIVRNEDAAREVLIHTFRDLPGALEKCDIEGFVAERSFLAFISKVAALRAKRRLRLMLKDRHRFVGDIADLEQLLTIADPTSAEEIRYNAERLVSDLLNGLPEPDGELVRLAKIEGRTLQEIHHIYAGRYTREAIKKRIQRAMATLESELERRQRGSANDSNDRH
jgi:RNA polymerase sigma factor (sigma-70 family)